MARRLNTLGEATAGAEAGAKARVLLRNSTRGRSSDPDSPHDVSDWHDWHDLSEPLQLPSLISLLDPPLWARRSPGLGEVSEVHEDAFLDMAMGPPRGNGTGASGAGRMAFMYNRSIEIPRDPLYLAPRGRMHSKTVHMITQRTARPTTPMEAKTQPQIGMSASSLSSERMSDSVSSISFAGSESESTSTGGGETGIGEVVGDGLLGELSGDRGGGRPGGSDGGVRDGDGMSGPGGAGFGASGGRAGKRVGDCGGDRGGSGSGVVGKGWPGAGGAVG